MVPEAAPRSRPAGRGVSPVVGAILMVGIVVAIAAVTTVMLTGFGDSLSAPAPQVALQMEYHGSGSDNAGKPYFTLEHRGGDVVDGGSLYVRDDDGNTVSWETVWTTDPAADPTDFAHIDGDGSDGALNHVCNAGQTYQLIHEGEDRSYVVAEYVVPEDATPGPAAPPGWC